MLSLFQPILDSCEPYLVITPDNRGVFAETIYGVAIREVYNPQALAHRDFIRALDQLNILNYGPAGLEMPRWAFYDCGIMPGFVFGFAQRVSTLPTWVSKALDTPQTYHGLVPLSMLIGIPMVDRETWLIYTVSSLSEVSWCIGSAGLAALTLIFACKGLGLKRMLSVNQWRSPKLQYFLQLGPLELITAHTPAHTEPKTATFALQLDDRRLAQALEQHDRHPACADHTELLDVDDLRSLMLMQAQLEAGATVQVVGPARTRGATTYMPIIRS